MAKRWVLVAGLIAACVALLAAPSAADPARVWASCSAVPSQDPRYANQWEYKLDIGWDTTGWEPDRLESVSLLLDLAACPCIGEPDYFAFPSTSGTGTGKDGATTHYYYSGRPYTEGSPGFETVDPALVFEYLDTTAVLNTRGTATFIFVSTARPGAYGARSDGIGIVVGPHEALGEITGVFPSCQCDPSPVEPAVTWGVIKAMFK